jgi:hypothetical protein
MLVSTLSEVPPTAVTCCAVAGYSTPKCASPEFAVIATLAGYVLVVEALPR